MRLSHSLPRQSFRMPPTTYHSSQQSEMALNSPPILGSLYQGDLIYDGVTSIHGQSHYYGCQIPTNNRIITDIQPNDVLSGRGGATNSHSGNRAFRSLVKQYQSNYLKVKKCDKPKVADTIVNIIHQKGGRFLKRHKSKGVFWVELSKDKAREKTCQALRERAPEIRRRRSVLDEDISSRHKDRDSSPSTVSVFNQSESGESDKLCNGVRTQILRTTLKHEKEEAISITEAPMIIRPFMALLCVELSEKQLKIPIDHLERQERDIYLRDFLPPVPSVQKKT